MNFELIHHTHFVVISSFVEKLDIHHASELKSEMLLLNKKGIQSFVLNLEKTKILFTIQLWVFIFCNI